MIFYMLIGCSGPWNEVKQVMIYDFRIREKNQNNEMVLEEGLWKNSIQFIIIWAIDLYWQLFLVLRTWQKVVMFPWIVDVKVG